MKAVILDGNVIATHRNDQDIEGKYPDGCEIIYVAEDFKIERPVLGKIVEEFEDVDEEILSSIVSEDGSVSVVRTQVTRRIPKVREINITPEPNDPRQNMSEEEKWSSVRRKRSELLRDSDWSQLSDTDLSTEAKQAWKEYRKALRDLPQDFTSVEEIIWPVKPE